MDAKDLEHYELASAVQKLADMAIETHAAFGMTLGYPEEAGAEVEWEAGCSTDDMAFPKRKRLDELTYRDMAATIVGAVAALRLLADTASPGVAEISAERGRQLAKGCTARTDQQYEEDELLELAKVMLEGDASPMTPGLGSLSGWDFLQKYRTRESRLAVAGALIAAELDRIQYRKSWEEREAARKQRAQGQ
jgi:hypothetical protein